MTIERPDALPEGSPAPAFRPSAGSRAEGRLRWFSVALLAGAVLLPAVLVSCGQSREAAGAKTAKDGAKPGKAGQRAIPVIGRPARAGDLGVYQTGLGSVMPLKTVTVKSRVDGELMNVAYGEGQFVRQGDLLAQIDPRPFQVQLLSAEGQLAKDTALLENARTDLERYRVLISEDSIPKQQLDTQAALVRQYEAALKSDQAAIESAKLNLTYSRITAPIAGVIGLRLVDPGNIVKAADPSGILVITQQQPIAVVFTVPADQLPAVLAQTKAGKKLVVEAWDRDLKRKLTTGSLLAIDNQIDPTTGTVKIKALFANEERSLYPGQFVNARLLVDTLKGTVLVPAAAVQRSPDSSYVYVVKADGSVELRKVEVSLTEGGETSIPKGLAAGEVVVVDGADKLQPGTKVQLSGGNGGNGGKKKG